MFIRGAEHLPPEANQVNQLMMQLVYEYNHSEVSDPFLHEARFHISPWAWAMRSAISAAVLVAMLARAAKLLSWVTR